MSFPRYPKYKDSGVEWLGEVPEGWEVVRLKTVCHVFPSNVDKHTVDGQAPVRLCNYTDVYYNDQIVDGMPFMEATATDEQIRRFTLRAGDTIITKDSETADDIAIAAYVPRDLPEVVCGYHLSMVRPLGAIDGAFVKRYFDSRMAKAQCAVLANGLTRVGLGQYALDNLLLPLPPPSEQAAISAFLDVETVKIDALVSEQARLIELLQEKRQAVISHAVTKGLNPDAPTKPSGIEWLGDVPAHWTPTRLKRLYRQQKRQNYPDKAVLSVYRDFGVVYKDSRTDNINKTPEDVTLYQLVQRRDLVINKMKAWQGSLGISTVEGITSPDYAVLVPLHREADAYLHLLFRSRALVSVYRGLSGGIRPDQWRIEPDAFLDLTVYLPPFEEQARIALQVDSMLTSYDTLITEARRAIDLLNERRAALISAAVTGQIDVRGLAPRGAA